ncbi:hypothetical protein GCM10009724_20790 [Microbacterium lacticum]|nr:hypothetical protein MLA01_20820 [Microbacterium lacticum]GGI69515.1 hypothetical protein GCM10009724_20790 [Microbacterium lacticum]
MVAVSGVPIPAASTVAGVCAGMVMSGLRLAHARVEDDPQQVAEASAAILAVMDGLQVQWLLDPTQVDLGRTSQFAIEAIAAAVLRPQTSVLQD